MRSGKICGMPPTPSVKEKACETASRLDETVNDLIASLDPHISELEKRLTRKDR